MRLFLDVRFLDTTSAEAMGVNREENIMVVIYFADNYLECDTVSFYFILYYAIVFYFMFFLYLSKFVFYFLFFFLIVFKSLYFIPF